MTKSWKAWAIFAEDPAPKVPVKRLCYDRIFWTKRETELYLKACTWPGCEPGKVPAGYTIERVIIQKVTK